MSVNNKIGLNGIRKFLESLFEEDVHAMRVLSMANATLGVLSSASLAVHAIGQGLAHARGLITKHAVKQVDRLLSTGRICLPRKTTAEHKVGPRSGLSAPGWV